jgi:hypothetical protein
MSDGRDDPFACFGDSSSSDSGGDDCPDDDNRGPDDDAVASGDRRRRAAASDLAESRRLRERSNAGLDPRPGRRTVPISDDSRFAVFDSGPSSGLGLRATIAYGRGDEILREYAVMRVPNSQRASSRDEAGDMHRLAVQRAYDSMHEDTRSAFMDLSSSCDGIGHDKTPRGIYDTNAFRLGDADRTGGLFLTIARMNHSCRPNVNHYWSPNLQMTLVFASRDIAAGEELRTTYGPSEWMNTKGRREFLCERFAFDCNCEMCVEGNDLGGDERMEAIRSLQEAIALSSSLVVDGGSRSSKFGGDSAVAALESVDRCLALMNEQGIGGGAFTKSIYHRGYSICDAAGDDVGARSYLVSELRAVRDSEGVYSPNAMEIERVLNFGVCQAG